MKEMNLCKRREDNIQKEDGFRTYTNRPRIKKEAIVQD